VIFPDAWGVQPPLDSVPHGRWRDNLAFSFLPAPRGREAVSGAQYAYNNTPTFNYGYHGVHAGFSQLSSFTPNSLTFSGARSAADSFTLLVVLNYWNGTNSAGGAALFATAGHEGLTITSSGAPRLNIGGTTRQSTRTLSTSTPYVLALRFITAVGADYWINGVGETRLADDGRGFTNPTFAYMGGDPVGGDTINAGVAALHWWNAALSDADIVALSLNPWQVYGYWQAMPFVLPVAAAGDFFDRPPLITDRLNTLLRM